MNITRSLCFHSAFTALLVSSVSFQASAQEDGARPLLAPYIADHSVLQRSAEVAIAGFGQPGEMITLKVDGLEGDAPFRAEATVDQNGRWKAVLPPQKAATNISLTVRSESGREVTVSDILFGDLWLCSGQSNMDLPIERAANSRNVLRSIGGDPVRIMQIAQASSANPGTTFASSIPWGQATAENLPGFSSACWHMGLELTRRTGVPIGLIQASRGGSSLEDWSSIETMAAIGNHDADIALLQQYATSPKSATSNIDAATEEWAKSVDPGEHGGWATAEYDDAQWLSMQLPGYWERKGIKELASFSGTLWYRRIFEIDTERELGGDAILNLGRVDERDTVWINGTKIGTTSISAENRAYAIPAGILKQGSNRIAIRVVDHKGSGGLAGPADTLRLEYGDHTMSLAGSWKYRVGAASRDWSSEPPFVPWATPRGMSVLYNAMIAPLEGMQLKGVAWYQGESNASEYSAYADLFPIWRDDWRDHFGMPDLPFVVVQLPGFGALKDEPSDHRWARMREVQRLAVANDTRSGLAVSIDLGTVDDIHPTHKLELGNRMAREAIRVAYGGEISAPVEPLAARPDGTDIVVTVKTDAALPLRVMGGNRPIGFELCTKDECRFTDSIIEGGTIRISGEGIAASTITEVRYAWQASPIVNLYDAVGIPVVPFRMAIER